MIDSKTDFLEIITGIEQFKFFDPIFKETITAKECFMKERRKYVLRYTCIQAHFLRTPYNDKIKFLSRLLDEIKSMSGVMVILGAVSKASGKMRAYMKTMISTPFIYDKTFHSHNRSMEKKALRETQEEDLQWFCTLSEMDKIPVIIGLIRMSSGAMILKMEEHLKPLLNKKLKPPSDINYRLSQINVPQKLGWKLDERLKELLKGDYETTQYDPRDPLAIEVEKLRKKWDDKMAQYIAEIEAVEQANKPEKEKGKKGGSPQDKQNKGKKEKKKGKERKGKKEKKKKDSNKEGKIAKDTISIDRIQLLPVWIVKRILSYLDKKTLDICKKVNDYWKYLVNDYLKEIATRAKLDKEIKRIEETFTHEYGTFLPQPQPPYKPRISFQQKRFLKLTETACCSEKVRMRLYKPHNYSLISTAPKLLRTSYALPVKHLLSFPRSTCTPYKLYRPRSAVCLERGYIHAIRGNLITKTND